MQQWQQHFRHCDHASDSATGPAPAEMCYEPDRTGLGQGPSARTASCYNEVRAQILNLWKPGASRSFYISSHMIISLPSITRIRFRFKLSHAESSVTRTVPHTHPSRTTSIPLLLHPRCTRTFVLPGHMINYNASILYPGDTGPRYHSTSLSVC